MVSFGPTDPSQKQLHDSINEILKQASHEQVKKPTKAYRFGYCCGSTLACLTMILLATITGGFGWTIGVDLATRLVK